MSRKDAIKNLYQRQETIKQFGQKVTARSRAVADDVYLRSKKVSRVSILKVGIGLGTSVGATAYLSFKINEPVGGEYSLGGIQVNN